MAIRDTERGLIARYIARVLERGDLPLRATRHILGWLNERGDALALPLPKPLSKAIGNIYNNKFKFPELEAAYAAHRDQVIAMLRQAAEETAPPEPLASNVRRLTEALKLPDAAWKIMGLIAAYPRFEQVEYLCDNVIEAAGPMTRGIALLVGEPTRTVEQLLAPLGELSTSGLIQSREHGDQLAGAAGRYGIPWRIDVSLDQSFANFHEMRHTLLGQRLKTSLDLDDYQHIAKDRDLIVGVLKGAAERKAHGVNILLYGPPGSGKTELTKMACQAAGLDLYAAGEQTPANDNEAERSERLADLVFALKLMAGSEKNAILFDEMEDVAWQLIRRGGSKVYLNRVLENNPVPVLWTSNNIAEIDPAVLRRMTLAIEVKQPPPKQRERILKRLDRRIGVGLSEDEIHTLARNIDTTPAVLENALKAALFSDGGSAAVERAARGVVRAISGGNTQKPQTPPDFDPKMICARPDLVTLTEQLKAGERLGFSLLLSGPPGTGKSAYGRYLAQELGLEIIHKRASDLLGAFVGESEANIADAFEQARENNALLIFDEAESFLFDRREAVRSWEITQVNEMLTWMEDHPLPVCCTTNLMDRFDRASMRRFTFHVQFSYLDQDALKRAYQVFFNCRNVPAEGLALGNLTPGDFAQARRQAEVLGVKQNIGKVIDLLSELSLAKPGTSSNIGFRPSRP